MRNLSEADIQLLEDFWNDQLASAPRQDLQQRLKDDPDFAAAAAEWQLVITQGFALPDTEQQEIAEIKDRLQGYSASEEEPPVAKVRKLKFRKVYLLGAAAAALLLLFVFTPLNRVFQSESPYAESFTHLSRDNANLGSETQDGREAYDQKNYQVAFPALLAEVAAGGDSLNLIYAGVAAIGSGQADKAIPVLEPLLGNTSWRFYQTEIEWYLALAYLNTENEVQASALLENISKTESPYAGEAEKLRAMLK